MVEEEGAARARAPFELTTDRLALAPVTRGDRDALQALFRDAGVRRFLWDDTLVSTATVEEVIEASLESFRAAGFGHWALRLRGSRVLVGFCGLRREQEGPEIEILYALHPDHWRAGLAREACRAVLGHAFETLGLARVAGRVDTPNGASVRVLEALGMAFEGERAIADRPTRHYALSRAAWAAGSPPPRP
jgi:[ribosomal protein S5]-alanine N-acetyltransferase